MLLAILNIIEWLFNFLKPSDARMLGRTEAELANANKVLQEVSDAKKVESDVAKLSDADVRVQLSKWQRKP